MIVRIVGPGEVLALSAVVCGTTYEGTARAIDECHTSFVKRRDILDLLQKNQDAAFNAVRELSSAYQRSHEQICSLGLSASAGDKLARLFLSWCQRQTAGRNGVRIPLNFTHEEIGEMIGTSRETVTRLIQAFRKRGLIVLEKKALWIPNVKSLKAAIGTAFTSTAATPG